MPTLAAVAAAVIASGKWNCTMTTGTSSTHPADASANRRIAVRRMARAVRVLGSRTRLVAVRAIFD